MRIDTSTNPNNAIRQELKRFDTRDKFFIEEVTDVSQINFLNLNQKGEKKMDYLTDYSKDSPTIKDDSNEREELRQSMIGSFSDMFSLIDKMREEHFDEWEIAETIDDNYIDATEQLLDCYKSPTERNNNVHEVLRDTINNFIKGVNHKERIEQNLKRNNHLT